MLPKTVAVVGAGLMGSGITQKIIQSGYPVILHDRDGKALEKCLEKIAQSLYQGVALGLFTTVNMAEFLKRVQTTTDLADLSEVDLLVEAVFEDLKLKQNLFKDLEAIVKPDTILGTNTSSFLVKEIAEAVDTADRVIGLHYFYHAAKNSLLEIIPHEFTSDDCLQRCKEFGRSHRKTVIVCRDLPGFVVNRFYIPWRNEAFRLLEEGAADIYSIEEVLKQTFNIGLGPFGLNNLTGTGVAYHASLGLASKLGDFYTPADNLKALALGEGKWPLPETGVVDESKRELIIERVMGAVFHVCTSLLAEGGARMEDIDTGAKTALRWSKGPFELMEDFGKDKSEDFIGRICKRYGLEKA